MNDVLNVLNKKYVVLILVLSMLFSLQGCMQYYKVKKVSNVSESEMEMFITQKKFFIIHQENEARYLSNAGIQGSVITGELVNLKENQMKFKSTKPKGATRFRNTIKHNESYIKNEVHLYLQKSSIKDFGSAKQVMIPLSDIAYTDVYLKAKGRTIFSWLVPIVSVYVGASIVLIISLANSIGNLDIM
jgi:uncharacterized lipoprotein YehR (DUF1307 family)